MATQVITLNVPGPLYEHLRQRAEEARRSVEEETLEVLATVMPGDAPLPPDLAGAIESLKLLDDETLWQRARHRLPDDESAELESLHRKRQLSRLADAESERLAQLVRQYETHMLVRAQAATLLQQRGHDVSELVKS